MNLDYQLLKAFHVTSLILWLGTMLLAPSIILVTNSLPDLLRNKLAKRYRKTLALLSTPAMLGTWLFGLGLMLQGSWYKSGWLYIKLLLVLIFSGLHGVFLGQLRKIEQSVEYLDLKNTYHVLFWLQLIMLFGVAALVLIKPI